MRSTAEMMELIRTFAEEEPDVRAVILNGSRANPHAASDRFQDYDVVFYVTDVQRWAKDRSWNGPRFGEILIMQTPDEWTTAADEPQRGSFAFLMLFTDGNRIDLTFSPVEHLSGIQHDSLSVLLLDKDGSVGTLPPPSIDDYRTEPPSAARFAECCNEFWWVSTYIAKGLWRGELYYASFHLERPVRDMLIRMLNWSIGVQSNFEANPGKLGKYYKELLPPDMWERFKSTFPDSEPEHMWRSLFVMSELFREAALAVAQHFGFIYNEEEDRRVTAYLRQIQASTDSPSSL